MGDEQVAVLGPADGRGVDVAHDEAEEVAAGTALIKNRNILNVLIILIINTNLNNYDISIIIFHPIQYLAAPREDERPDVAAVKVLGAVEQDAGRLHGHGGHLMGKDSWSERNRENAVSNFPPNSVPGARRRGAARRRRGLR